MKHPVLFLIFNRPDTTARVFKEIRRARPQKLLVVADGPRLERPGETEKCGAPRAIIEQMDWAGVSMNYTSLDMFFDMTNPLMYAGLIFGILTMQIRTAAELLFPLIRPYYLYKGNNSTESYVH
jgi:hypothetical protein